MRVGGTADRIADKAFENLRGSRALKSIGCSRQAPTTARTRTRTRMTRMINDFFTPS